MKSIFRLRVPVLVAFALTTLLSAQARTLFIDLNNADPEIEAIRRGANGKPEEVVVVPSYERISRKARLAVIQAQRDVDRFTEEAQNCAVETLKSRACHSVYDRIRAAELRRLSLIRHYTTTDLADELKQAAVMGSQKPFDMVVISGHHELGFYRGELAEIEATQLHQLVKDLPRLFKPIKTVLMLGCGTGTHDNYASVLAPTFDGAPLIVAAEDNAPLRDEPRNIAFVRKVMEHRTALLEAKSAKQVAPVYAQLLAKNWPVSILWRHQLIFFKDSVAPLDPGLNDALIK